MLSSRISFRIRENANISEGHVTEPFYEIFHDQTFVVDFKWESYK